MAKKRNTLKDFEQDIEITRLSELYTEIGLRRRKEKPLDIRTLMAVIRHRAEVLTDDLWLLSRVKKDMGDSAVKTMEGALLLQTLNKINAKKDDIFSQQKQDGDGDAKLEDTHKAITP